MSSSHDPDAASTEAARTNVRVDLPDAFQRGDPRARARAARARLLRDARRARAPRTPDEIRDAFFERSKTFHPDRYFKKELGPYAELLTEIYKRIVAAHDVLRDAKLRASYAALAHRQRPAAEARPPSRRAEARGDARASPSPAGRGSSLRNRLGLQSPGLVLDSLQTAARAEPRARDEALRGGARCRSRAATGRARRSWWSSRSPSTRARSSTTRSSPRSCRARTRSAPRTCGARPSCCSHGDRAGAAELLEEAAQLSPTDAELAHKLVEPVVRASAPISRRPRSTASAPSRSTRTNCASARRWRRSTARPATRRRRASTCSAPGSSIRWTRRSDRRSQTL